MASSEQRGPISSHQLTLSNASREWFATEPLFESYLRSQGLAWDYEPALGQKRPDYLLKCASGECVIELESLHDPDPLPTRGFAPAVAIREALRRARNQLREYKHLPAGIALFSESMLREVTAQTVSAAAFGPGFNESSGYDRLDPRARARQFAQRRDLPAHLHHLAKPFLSRDANRSISALVVLSHYQLSDFHLAIWQQLYRRQEAGEILRPGESMRVAAEQHRVLPRTSRFNGTLRVVIIENRYARIPFPEDLFRGPFDQRWGWRSNWCGPIWIGDEVNALYEQGVPFEML